MKAGERTIDVGGFHDLFDAQFLAKHCIGIAGRVTARLLGDLGEGFRFRPVFLRVLAPRPTKIQCSTRSVGIEFLQCLHFLEHAFHRIGSVGEHGPQCTRIHLLEAQRQGTIDHAGLDRLPREKQRRGTRGAIVVHVDDGHTRHAESIHRGLPGSRVTVHVADVYLADLIVGDTRIVQRQPRGRLPHDIVAVTRSRFGEWNHPHTDNFYAP